MRAWRRFNSRSPLLLAGALLAAVALASCDSPCKDLSEMVCSCERSQLEQQACVRRVDAESSQVPVSEEELEACAAIIESGSCTCEALAEGDLQACGLARE